MTEVLGTLSGDHEVLKVKVADLRPGDVLLRGHAVRVLVCPRRRYRGFVNWEVAKADGQPVVGTCEFRDDGVYTAVVLRPKVRLTEVGLPLG